MTEPDDHDDLERELGVFMWRLRAASARLSRAVHPELESAAYGLLSRLGHHGPLRPSELAGYLGAGKGTISRQLRALEDLGLVERHVDPGDRRAHRVALTEEGRERLEAVRSARRLHFRERLGDWPEEDIRTLVRLLGRFNAIDPD